MSAGRCGLLQRLAQTGNIAWPKIAQMPSMKRSPSSVICAEIYRTMAWAAVRRIVLMQKFPGVR